MVHEVIDAELVFAAVGVDKNEDAGCRVAAEDPGGLRAGDAAAVCGAGFGAGRALGLRAEEGALREWGGVAGERVVVEG